MQRFWEVDVLRGTAVVLMVAYHFFFDLNFLGVFKLDLYSGFFLFFQRITAFLFIALVGVSLVLFKQQNASLPKKDFVSKIVKRFGILSGVSVLITVSTLIYPGEGAIFFGIIHFIALSTLVALLFLEFNSSNLALGVLLTASSLFVSLPAINSPLLLWLGFPPQGFYTLDYYPLFPWFGLILIGLYAGKKLYENNERSFKLGEMPSLLKPLEFLGKNALVIYLLHQPVLFAGIKLFLRV